MANPLAATCRSRGCAVCVGLTARLSKLSEVVAFNLLLETPGGVTSGSAYLITACGPAENNEFDNVWPAACEVPKPERPGPTTTPRAAPVAVPRLPKASNGGFEAGKSVLRPAAPAVPRES